MVSAEPPPMAEPPSYAVSRPPASCTIGTSAGSAEGAVRARWEAARDRRGSGPRHVRELLPAVLNQMVGGDATERIESTTSGETP